MTGEARKRDRDARRAALERILHEQHPAVTIQSPPGAGKTSLIELIVATAVHHFKLRTCVVAPRREQVYDLVRRLGGRYAPMGLTLLHSSRDLPPPDVSPGIARGTSRAAQLPRGAVAIVATAAKLQLSADQLGANEFDLLICDEAYQLAWKDVSPMLHLARRVVLVGDPGQLPPLVRTDIARFEAARSRVHWAAPRELTRLHPQLPVLALPATWRFPQDTVRFVQPSFYPQLPFASAADDCERRISFSAKGFGDPVDRALDALAAGASIVGLFLPEVNRLAEDVDEELAELAATVARRILNRGGNWSGRGTLSARDIGYVDAHVASGAAVRRSFDAEGIGSGTMIETPEIWQGQERPVMLVKHPLSGARRFEGFALEPGRLSVMMSRHQVGCILLGRDGIGRALEQHQHDCADRPSGAADLEWDGWRAHRSLLSQLEEARRLFRV